MRIHRSAFALATCASASALAATPIRLVHEGFLLDGADQPVTRAQASLRFRIADRSVDDGAQVVLWEGSCPVNVLQGKFAVSLGDGTCGASLSSDVFPPAQPRFLEVSVDGMALLPRLRIGTVPLAAYASRAQTAEAVTAGAVGTDGLANGAVTLAKLAPPLLNSLGTLNADTLDGFDASAFAPAAVETKIDLASTKVDAVSAKVGDTAGQSLVDRVLSLGSSLLSLHSKSDAGAAKLDTVDTRTATIATQVSAVGTQVTQLSTSVAALGSGTGATASLDAKLTSLTQVVSALSYGMVQSNPATSCGSILQTSGGRASGMYWIDSDGSGPLPAAMAYCTMSGDGTQANPGRSCQEIRLNYPLSSNGTYWLDPNGGANNDAFEVACRQDLAGGGWTLAMNLDTNDGARRDWDDTGFWQQTASVGVVSTALQNDFRSPATGSLPVNEVLIVAHAEGAGWNGGVPFARYAVGNGHAGKTWVQLLQLPNNTQVAAGASERSGTVLTPGSYSRTAGDVFIDHGLPLIFNSTDAGGTDATNRARIGTAFSSICSIVSCNGHNVQGGYGGYHDRSGSYPLRYEAEPSLGYHPGPLGFGSDFSNPNGSSTVWNNTPSPGTVLQVDFAIYIR